MIWRHTDEAYSDRVCAAVVHRSRTLPNICGCTALVPDRDSPCARPDCYEPKSFLVHWPCANLDAPEHDDQWCHDRVPSLCACGHRIVMDRDAPSVFAPAVSDVTALREEAK